MKTRPDRKIILESGQEFYGTGFGSPEDRVCEIVFNTSMAGYQEILSDLSYADQAVVMTYPSIGNYGMADEDYESEIPAIGALIVRACNAEPSNFRCRRTLQAVMEEYGIPGISGVDTRALGRLIRDYGTQKALITNAACARDEGLRRLAQTELPHDAVSRVSCRGRTVYYPSLRAAEAGHAGQTGPGVKTGPAAGTGFAAGSGPAAGMGCAAETGNRIETRHVVIIDCGMKKNIVRSLYRRGCMVTMVPWNTSAREIRAIHPDGILVSNGPGDPTDVPETIAAVRSLLGDYPVFGICLGHQILSLACGAGTYKLKFGHRGGNHPVKNLETGKIEITSQNHSYAIDPASLAATPLQVTHVNLLDQTIEGVACPGERAFGVQYHPESAPGPQDSAYLFDRFLELLRGN